MSKRSSSVRRRSAMVSSRRVSSSVRTHWQERCLQHELMILYKKLPRCLVCHPLKSRSTRRRLAHLYANSKRSSGTKQRSSSSSNNNNNRERGASQIRWAYRRVLNARDPATRDFMLGRLFCSTKTTSTQRLNRCLIRKERRHHDPRFRHLLTTRLPGKRRFRVGQKQGAKWRTIVHTIACCLLMTVDRC